MAFLCFKKAVKNKLPLAVISKILIMPRLTPFYLINFTCDTCQQEYQQATAYSPAQQLNQLAHFPTYCANCVEEPEVLTCSFFQRIAGQIITCEQPLFDKKKALCRHHNRQVRQRFNQFTKEMSISSDAA
jgi:hypothetical protein